MECFGPIVVDLAVFFIHKDRVVKQCIVKLT